MKTTKSLLLLALIGLSVISMAQIVGVNHPVALNSQKKQLFNHTSKEGEVVHWQVTFEEATPIWTFGHDAGEQNWIVSDTTITGVDFENGVDFTDDDIAVGTVVSSMWLYMGRRDLGEYSESGGNFAYFDAITNALLGAETAYNAWIQFDDIDFIEVSNPKLIMCQLFKGLNSGATYIDYSLDNGANWTSIEVNTEVEGNQYGDDILEIVLPLEIGGQPNVDFRFRFQADNTSVNGYGWQIDDIKIVNNLEVDMVLKKGVMNFFSYVDYTNPEYSDYFHSSSHYGQIPQDQFESDMGVMVFNGIVESKGNLDIVPEFNVTVLDPDMSEIYNETVLGVNLSTGQVDTIDLLVELALGTNPVLGEYTVVYNLIADNEEFPADNIDTTYFNVTENIMGRDLNHMTDQVSTSIWIGGGNDGDMVGTTYAYLYDTEVTRMDVFISEQTTAGTSIVGKVFQFDETAGEFLAIAASSIFVIEEAMLGTWQSIEFPDPISIQTNDGMAEVLAAVELYFGGNNIFIGTDETMVSSPWSTFWSFVSTGSDFQAIGNYSGAGLGIRLISGETAPQYYFFDEQHTICEGESYYWQGNYYDESGTYLAEYQTANGCCDSIYVLDLTVLPPPQQYSLIQTPSNGILQTGEFGEISLSLSETNVDYWVTRAGVIYSATVSGTGSMLSLGTNFVAGTYDVWSQNELGCEILQGSVTFIEDNGNNQLIANITYGANAMNFPANEVEVTLYKVTTDIEMNEVIAAAQQQMLGNSGYVVFETIEPGDYYLGSALLNPDNFDVSTHVYYESALTHEDASIITIDADDMFVATLHHPTMEGLEGSNTLGGIVGEGNTKSDLSPLADMIVVMQDAISEQVLDVAVTNSEGQYTFEVIPDNASVELYVTSFAHQVWTPFVLETSTDETYEVNFMVSGNEVYPMSIRNPENQVLIDASIYPNPSTGMITIESKNLNIISVSSLDGKEMIHKAVSDDKITLDLSDFSAGMYLIKLETENGVRVEKIVIE
jgi:hypothetical protein